MMQLVIERAGLSWLIDAGVRGFAQYGLPEGGPLDPRAAAAAWALCGANGETEPWWLEVGPLPFAARFEGPATVALLGASRPTRVSGCEMAAGEGSVTGQRFFVDAGTKLELGPSPGYGPTYLTARADLTSRAGGGRTGALVSRLQDGDVFAFLSTGGGRRARAVLEPGAARSMWTPESVSQLRFLAGPEYEEIRRAVGATYGVGASGAADVWWFAASPQMDRRALRLVPCRDGPAAHSPVSLTESSPTAAGLIQWPEGGTPIILRPDRQTMGGYPRFGAVIAADRRRLAWVSPGDVLALRLVDRAEALQAYVQERRADRVLERFLRLATRSRDRS